MTLEAIWHADGEAICVQCKNCNILQKMKGALRLKVVGTEEAIISLPEPAAFWKDANLFDGKVSRPYGRVVESCLLVTPKDLTLIAIKGLQWAWN